MQNDFIFMTDDSCDLPRDYLEVNRIPVVQLGYTINGVYFKAYDKTPEEFYDELRAGKMPVTSQVTPEAVRETMLPLLQEGKDIFYLAFTSGLSGTYNSGMITAKELAAQFPERKIRVVDSLCASLGQGLLVYKTLEQIKNGATIDEAVDYAEKNKMNVLHVVMADNLMHLHRGGRVSRASAVAGSMLGIKPIIHVNNEGRLVAIHKVRGKKQALTYLADYAQKRVGNMQNDILMVSNASCEEDANFVADLTMKRLGIRQKLVNSIGPVIGTHTGIGTVAMFLFAEQR